MECRAAWDVSSPKKQDRCDALMSEGGVENVSVPGRARHALDFFSHPGLTRGLRKRFCCGAHASRTIGDIQGEEFKGGRPRRPTVHKVAATIASGCTRDEWPIHGGVCMGNWNLAGVFSPNVHVAELSKLRLQQPLHWQP